jgi:hypothetical protein
VFEIRGDFSNTSELATVAEVRVAAQPAPTAAVQCTIRTDRPSEAAPAIDTVEFAPTNSDGMMVVAVIGVKDVLDDVDVAVVEEVALE